MKLRKNKKAIQLSVNMLVVIILAVVIFSFGVAFMYNIVSKSFKLKGTVDEDLDRQIETILCDKPVCLSANYKKIFRGDFEIVGLRIYNTRDVETTFSIIMERKGAFDKEGKEMEGDLFVTLGTEITQREITIPSRSERGIGIGVEVPKNAESGIYVYNLNVYAGGADYPPPQQIRIEVP
ncbi:hypothetical protein KY343_06445 [Candidatus Woesearchaeota archaeon]|nr:hypothetical protein [Candidatus Woesearchaeota archaeon]